MTTANSAIHKLSPSIGLSFTAQNESCGNTTEKRKNGTGRGKFSPARHTAIAAAAQPCGFSPIAHRTAGSRYSFQNDHSCTPGLS